MRERRTGPPQRSRREPPSTASPKALHSQRPQGPAGHPSAQPGQAQCGPSRSDRLTREAPTQSGSTAPAAQGTNSHACPGNPWWRRGTGRPDGARRVSLQEQALDGSSRGWGSGPPHGPRLRESGLRPGSTRGRLGMSDASPEGWVREGVRGQVARVVVGCGGGRVQAERRQGGHAEVLGRVVGPKAPQVVLGHRAGGYHVVHGPLQAAGRREWWR